MTLFIGDHGEGLPRRAALIGALRIAARNWRRERFTTGPGEYWYGSAALARWIADIGKASEFTQTERRNLCGIGWWNFTRMHDARIAAVTFLRENAPTLNGAADAALARAAEEYAREADLLASALAGKGAFVNDVEKWSPKMRKREMEILTQAREIEEATIAEIEKALGQIESE